MSERGLPIADGAHACPFVAFEDDRDERSTVPDLRHRCYAEIRPAPRALAHQEAYCLSSAFPVCPTFQDWARRESARARGGSGAANGAAPGSSSTSRNPALDERVPPPVVAAGLAAAADAADPEPTDEIAPLPAGAMWAPAPVDEAPRSAGRAADADADADAAYDDESDPRRGPSDEPRRNPPREWSAPPPWLASAEAANRSTAGDAEDFVARRTQPGAGLAGSAADRLAGGGSPDEPYRRPPPASTPPGAPRRRAQPRIERDAVLDDIDPEASDAARPASQGRRTRAYDQHLGGPAGPDWERPRRYEAYPTIQTRMGMPNVPRLAYMAAAVALLALALFLLPGLLGMGSDEPARSTPSPSVSAEPSGSAAPPTPTPAPTPIIYTIQAGDTLSSIATANGLTLEQLLAANEDITNPNLISAGQRIIIPAPSATPPEQFGGSPSAAPAASP